MRDLDTLFESRV